MPHFKGFLRAQTLSKRAYVGQPWYMCVHQYGQPVSCDHVHVQCVAKWLFARLSTWSCLGHQNTHYAMHLCDSNCKLQLRVTTWIYIKRYANDISSDRHAETSRAIIIRNVLSMSVLHMCTHTNSCEANRASTLASGHRNHLSGSIKMRKSQL